MCLLVETSDSEGTLWFLSWSWNTGVFPQGYLKVYQGLPNKSTRVNCTVGIEPHPSGCPVEAPSGVWGLCLVAVRYLVPVQPLPDLGPHC